MIERASFKPLERLSDNTSTSSACLVLTHGGRLHLQPHGTVFDVRTDTTYSSDVLMGFRTVGLRLNSHEGQSCQLHDGLSTSRDILAFV